MRGLNSSKIGRLGIWAGSDQSLILSHTNTYENTYIFWDDLSDIHELWTNNPRRNRETY
jgi:hypothetical protein